MANPVEVNVPLIVTGTLDTVLKDPSTTGIVNNVIKQGETPEVEVTLDLNGTAAILLGGGDFKIHVAYEGIGAIADEGDTVQVSVAAPGTDPSNITATVHLPSDLAVGVYKVVTVVTYEHLTGFTAIAAFHESDMMMIAHMIP